MTRAAARIAVAVVVLGLAGCGAAPATPPPSSAPPPASPAVDPTRSADQQACAGHAQSADTVRAIARALREGPVLPAGVALFLLDVRSRAAAQGIADPQLAAAQAELVAAIDDLDAQGRALLPAGGNPAQDTVQLDPTRIAAAVEAVDTACAAG